MANVYAYPSKPPYRANARLRGRSISALLKLFVGYLAAERCLSPLTIQKYVHAVRRLKSWARWKCKGVLDLTAKDCNRWKLGMLREGLAPGTVNVMLIGAKRFFRYLQLNGYAERNPFELVGLQPIPRRLPHYLNQQEIDRLLAAPDVSTSYGLMDRAILELLYAAGLRPAELVSLELTSVDLGRRLLICLGKGGKQRFVPFGRSARDWLEKYLSRRRRITGKDRTRYFFVKEDGERLSTTYVRRYVKKYGMNVGLNELSPRVLRHTFATHLHEGGAEIVHVQLLIGHSRTDSTQVYTHVMPKRLREVYDSHHPRAGIEYIMPEKKAQRLNRIKQATGR